MVAVLPAAADAKLCPDCRDGTYVMTVGECAECPGQTASGAFKLCKACSDRLGQCEHCRRPPAGRAVGTRPDADKDVRELATRRFGKWTHRTYYANASSRSRATVGELTYDGKAITVAGHGDFLWSPWGRLICYRRRFIRGWLRPRTKPVPQGKQIASPDPETSARVRKGITDVEKDLKDLSVAVTFIGIPSAGYRSLILTAGTSEGAKPPADALTGKLSKRSARGIVARLATEGFFARALAGEDVERMHARAPIGPRYLLAVKAGTRWWRLDIGWGPETLRYLDALRSGLEDEGDAKAVDDVLASLGKLPGQWRSAGRARRLKADRKAFRLWLRHEGPAGKPFYTIHYTIAPGTPSGFPPFLIVRHVTADQAARLIDALAAAGLLAEMAEVDPVATPHVTSQAYSLEVAGSTTRLWADLGWDAKTLARLDALQAALPAPFAGDLGKLLARLAGLRKPRRQGRGERPD
jgi:hypothetical protein